MLVRRCQFLTLAIKSELALSYRFTFSAYAIMHSRLSGIANNQLSAPLEIVCGALITTGLDFLKLKRIIRNDVR